MITDKKGVKYYYGNTTDYKQIDPANTAHIFRWALNRVEDLNGNYMTISYLQDNGQLYPQTISYTGNSQASLNLSTYAQVSISYAPASQFATSYISGFFVETAKRLSQISSYVGSNLQTQYNFLYIQSQDTGRDLLQSVQQVGSDGKSALPAISFIYSDGQTKGFTNVTNWLIPKGLVFFSDPFDQYGVHQGYFNGDGFPDFVRNSDNPSIISAMFTGNKLTGSKNDVKGWTQDSSWNLSNLPILYNSLDNGADASVEVADINGDGLADIVKAGYLGEEDNDNVDNGPGSVYINTGNKSFVLDNSWAPSNSLVFSICLAQEPSILTGTLATVDGSGFPDFIVSMDSTWRVGSSVISSHTYLNQAFQGGKGFFPTSNFQPPSDYFSSYHNNGSDLTFNNGGTVVDLNGDGLADFINVQQGTGNALVYTNNGKSWVKDTTSTWANSIASLGYITSQIFVDVNGDGLPDLVYLDQNNNMQVAINTGNGFKLQSGWKLSDSIFSSQSRTNFQFVDISGNSMPGILYFDIYGNPKEFENKFTIPVDLLTSINNGIGSSSTITYQPSTWYNNTFLPYSFPVVKSVATTVANPIGSSSTYTTNYNYANGNWDKTYREFQGFGTVTVIDANGNYVISTYLQDHWLKGRPSQQDTYDAKGNLYSKSINQWQTQTITTNVISNQISKFAYVSRTDNYLYDGNSNATPKRTAQEYTYAENPQYGDITQTVNDGQVDLVKGTSVDLNKTTSQVSYVNNTSNWLIGLPSQTITQDINAKTISKTSFFYDNDTTGTATPSLGRLTAKINWLGSTTQSDPKTTYSYDVYGNLQTTTDPNGNTTTITYDSTVYMFPVQTINALKQTIIMTYYGIDTALLNNGQGLQGLWGQERSKTDANNQTAYTTYDTFGRPSTSISPLDTVFLPTQQKTYNIQSNYIAVTDTARVNNGGTATISSVSYYDGLGRLIETKSLGPTTGQYIVSGQTVYDNRGLPVTKYLPYFTTNDLNTLDSINTAVSSSTAVYDPMGRIITKTNPDGSYSNLVYNQWTTTTTDENGHMQKSYTDAFGRLIQKEEYLGADGRSSIYPSSAYVLYATTSYSYNPQGNLTSVMDAHNNVTTVAYDNLGRKIKMNDPDMGAWQYSYDANGNLIAQEDAKGQVTSFKYDVLNRLLNKTDAVSGPIVNLPNLPVVPATFNVNYNFDDKTQTFGQGRLGSVNYDTGTAGFVYDALGREITSNKSMEGTNYNVTRQYDA